MTIQDVLNECTSWEHSKEHYELMRECSELKLMEQYIADQQYMIESAADETFKAFQESGMFMEAATADRIKAITEEAEVKKASIWKRIGSGFAKLFNAIASFFKGLFAKITKADEKLVAFCKDHQFTDDEKDVLKKIFDEGVANGYTLTANANVNANAGDINNILAFVVGQVVKVDVTKSTVPNAVELEKFLNVWDTVEDKDSFTDRDLTTLNKGMQSCFTANDNITIAMFSGKNKNDADIQKLEAIKAAVSAIVDDPEFKVEASAAGPVYEKLNQLVPDTIKFYTSLKKANDALRAKIKEFMK